MQRSAIYHIRSVLRQTWRHPANRRHRGRAVARALAWQGWKRVVRRPRDVPFHGFVLRAHPDSQSASDVIYFTERFDVDEMAFVEAFLRPGDRFLDVGANIGTYSLLARSVVGPSGRVDAVEPHPVAAARLRENVERNGLDNVIVHEVAASDVDGTAELIDGADVSNRLRVTTDATRPTLGVATARLEDVVPEGPIVLGKIDVEGHETAALRGWRSRLAQGVPSVWLIELLDHQLAKAGSSRSELVELLADHGYRLAEAVAGSGLAEAGRGGSGLRLRWVDPTSTEAWNVWAIHDDAVALVEERLGRAVEPAVGPVGGSVGGSVD